MFNGMMFSQHRHEVSSNRGNRATILCIGMKMKAIELVFYILRKPLNMASNVTSFLDKTNIYHVLMEEFLLYVSRNHRYLLIGSNIHMVHNNLLVMVSLWMRLEEHTVLPHCQNFRRSVSCSDFARNYSK